MPNLNKYRPCLFNASAIIGLATLSFALASCGGGGGSGSTANTTATISSVSPVGMVASGTARALSLTGTNFASGMTVSVTDGSTTYTTGTVTVQSANLMSTTVTIPTAPTSRYVTVTVKSSTGVTQASTILGVASVSKVLQSNAAPATTDIQYIFNTYCTGCHGTDGNLDLSTKTLSASNLIQTLSNGPNKCTNRFRVTAGDPRAASSFLIDKITNLTPCGGGVQMPKGATATPFTQTEINAITDWIAGGAN